MTDDATAAVSKLPKPRHVLLVNAPSSVNSKNPDPEKANRENRTAHDAAAKRIRKNGPASGAMEIFEQNWLWAQQWRDKDPAGRVVLELPFGVPLGTFELALRVAAATAREGKDILLLTGHGVAQDGIHSESAFNTLPEQGRMATHKHLITQGVLDLPKIAERKGTRWLAKPGPDAKDKQILIDKLAPRFDLLERTGVVFKQSKIKSFFVLSCNVGSDRAFRFALAKLLQTPVKMYSDLLAMSEETFTTGRNKQVKMLAFLVPPNERANAAAFRPSVVRDDGSFILDHPGFTEPPPGASTASP